MNDYYVSIRKFPDNLRPNDENLFVHELERKFPQNKIKIFNWILVDSNGTFCTYKNLPLEITKKSSVYPLSRRKYFFFLIKSFFSGQLKILRRNCIWFTDNWSKGYFHWMMDALPRLIEVENNGHISTIYLPSFLNDNEYVDASLKRLGYQNIKYMIPDQLYLLRKMVFQTHIATTGNYKEENLQKLKKRFTNSSYTQKEFTHNGLYISRKKAQRRRILNEDEIYPILKKYKIAIVFFEDLSWHQQVELCINTHFIIGLHGAGLTNMLFMPSGSKILEFRKVDDNHNNCYFSLANALNHKYYYQLLEADKEEVLNADFNIDPTEFEMNIQKILDE